MRSRLHRSCAFTCWLFPKYLEVGSSQHLQSTCTFYLWSLSWTILHSTLLGLALPILCFPLCSVSTLLNILYRLEPAQIEKKHLTRPLQIPRLGCLSLSEWLFLYKNPRTYSSLVARISLTSNQDYHMFRSTVVLKCNTMTTPFTHRAPNLQYRGQHRARPILHISAPCQ